MSNGNKTQSGNGEKVITTVCSSHCGGKCIVKVHVKQGIITRIETDETIEPQSRACARGRAYRQRLYSPERLQYPLRRTGERGQAQFERITWDEALNTVATELKRVKESYGPAAILFLRGGGDLVSLHNAGAIDRLLAMFGGYTKTWGTYSNEAGAFADLATFGTMRARSTYDDLLNSRLIILWGWNPADTNHGNASWYLSRAKENGVKIISVDPRYTNTAATFANKWIPIRPGTDTAMLAAMAYVIIERHLQDQAFLDKYTVGFDQFKDYVTGQEDGIPKTPRWAESITAVSADTIEKLAVEYATTKPAALIGGISPGRAAYGEQYHRAAITLSAMTGNIGVRGGSSAGMVWAISMGGFPFLKFPLIASGIGNVDNPVEQGASLRKYALPSYGKAATSARIHFTKIADAILKGKDGGYSSDYKLLYVVNTGYPNQLPNINKSIKALQKLEFFVAHEQFMTPTARFADIVLPTSSVYEIDDLVSGHVTPPFYGYLHKIVEPLGETKSHFEIASELAVKLGISDYSDKTQEEWLREIVSSSISDYDSFKERGFYKVNLPEPHVAFKEQIEDPVNHPFPTPSGKIEIYSQQLADMNNPELPPVPKYLEAWESYRDPLVKQYPLQLVTTHFLRRAHTQFENVPWLKELQEQALFINPVDAENRYITDGDMVRVFNDRGEMIILSRVTERIMPGVVDIPQGAWFDPDRNGVDREGSVNVLTRDEPSPGGALASNTALVQIEKA